MCSLDILNTVNNFIKLKIITSVADPNTFMHENTIKEKKFSVSETKCFG